jgi:hypothetical protein
MGLNERTVGYILYAVGIIGGAEGASGVRTQDSFIISVVAMIVIIIASYLLGKK